MTEPYVEHPDLKGACDLIQAELDRVSEFRTAYMTLHAELTQLKADHAKLYSFTQEVIAAHKAVVRELAEIKGGLH